MSIPTTFEPLHPNDFTLRRIKVKKTHNFSSNDDDLTLLHAHHSNILPQPENENFDSGYLNENLNVYARAAWKQIDHLYFRDLTEYRQTHNYYNRTNFHRFLNYSASLISIPYLKYGEKIEPGTVKLTTDNNEFIDDGNGNLIHASQNNVYYPNESIVGYWGFNDLYRHTRFNTGSIKLQDHIYNSSQISSRNYRTVFKDVNVVPGVDISGINTGGAIQMNSTGSYAITPHHSLFNFDNESEFSISFCVNPEGHEGSIISKRGVVFETLHGLMLYESEVHSKDYKRIHTSNKYLDRKIDRYPYDFKIESNNLIFRRSDGSRVVELTGTVNTNSWNYITVIRFKDGNNFKLRLLINENIIDEKNDNTNHPINQHCLMFGSVNRRGDETFKGKIDEVRIVNEVITDSSGNVDSVFYSGLGTENNAYQIPNVGNVFYESGKIIFSPIDSNYFNELYGDWNLQYKSNHHIYNYEALCRIPKGSFNLTTNPTARKDLNGDRLLDTFKTNHESGSLRPYAETIGLFNDKGELVAVGKFGQAIQMRDDVDLNVVVKWDV